MVSLEKQIELREKLANWLEKDEDIFLFWRNEKTLEVYSYMRPDFLNSLDACFKWLVPKLSKRGFNIHIHIFPTHTKVIISNAFTTYFKRDKDTTQSLCLAIEKLIDAGGKSE